MPSENFRRFKILIGMIALMLAGNQGLGQKQGNVWYFGDSAGIDFNTNPPSYILGGQTDFHLPLGWNEATSSIADSSGSLLFYSNGERVWNRFHQVMPNGDGLLGHSSSAAAALIVPQPNSDRFFYLFTTDASEHGFLDGLNYSLIDMCLDNGSGDIVPGEKNIHLVDTTSEKLEAVRHANGEDYWIITHKMYSTEFWSLLLTGNGIVDTVISATPTPDVVGWGGHLVISPNGQRLAYAINSIQPLIGRGLLYDFDPSTGMVSNERVLVTGGRLYGASFSPDDSKLYFSTAGIGELFQFDLTAGSLADVIASKHYLFQGFPDQWRHQQIGPDGDIYISRVMSPWLAKIQNPNAQGFGAFYVDTAIYLGGRVCSHGLPNLVTAFDYSNGMTDCIVESIEEIALKETCSIYPNPMSRDGRLTLSGIKEPVDLEFFDLFGRPIFTRSGISNGDRIDRPCKESGVVLYRILRDHVIIHTGRLLLE